MDKETLSNYGWIVICVLVLAVMIALATPFGTFVADGFKATYTGLFQTGDSALDVGLNAVGVSNKLPCGHGRKEAGDHSQKECGHYNCDDTDCGCVPAACGIEGHWSGDGKDHTTVNHSDHTYACQCEGWVIPKGGTYTTASGTVYNSGEQLPCGYSSSQTGDTFQYGDYIYTARTTDSNAWSVTGVVDKNKTTYGTMIESINNDVVDMMDRTFVGCTALENAPVIPNSIKQLVWTFRGCTSLTSAPTIHNGVTWMNETFGYCTNLTGTIQVPCVATTIYVVSGGTPATVEVYHYEGCGH